MYGKRLFSRISLENGRLTRSRGDVRWVPRGSRRLRPERCRGFCLDPVPLVCAQGCLQRPCQAWGAGPNPPAYGSASMVQIGFQAPRVGARATGVPWERCRQSARSPSARAGYAPAPTTVWASDDPPRRSAPRSSMFSRRCEPQAHGPLSRF
jgi:hypothetical protein